ncbi:MAG: hypothetical protein ACR2N2_08810 [Acidimicrobiia bacterium]
MKRTMLLLAGIALIVAACGGADDSQVASLDGGLQSQDESAESASQKSDEEALLAFSACMRDNGVEDFEDPIVNADGSVEFGALEGSGTDPFGGVDREVVEAAFSACTEYLEGLSFGPGGADFDLTEIEDTFVEFAACMRDNGIEIDDPDFSNLLGGGEGGSNAVSPFGDLDFADPEVRAALEECQEAFAGFGRFGGGDS